MMIELKEIVYDIRARDGTWCKLPYLGHRKGCPNFPRCPAHHRAFLEIKGQYEWFGILEEFDLRTHAEGMRFLHPAWSERQCRNLLYWQPRLRAVLRSKAYCALHSFPGSGIVLEIPEACGVNVFETMAKVGILIDRQPQIVRKVMLVGKSLDNLQTK